MRTTKALGVGLLTVLIGFAASSTALAEIQLTIQNGRVTLIAKDATLRQILAEWAKVGQTKIVNGERVPGPPLTLQLTNVPEVQALDVLLRSLSGYVAAPRPAVVANASQFDRILIIPTTAPAGAPAPMSASSPPPPPFQQSGLPMGMPPPQSGLPMSDDQDEDPRGPNRNPVFIASQPQVLNPMAQGVPTASPGGVAPVQGMLNLPPPPVAAQPYSNPPTSPFGVSVPGMIVPAPQQPGQPLNGQAPPKRPGGGH
jgi:hypothetical protein